MSKEEIDKFMASDEFKYGLSKHLEEQESIIRTYELHREALMLAIMFGIILNLLTTMIDRLWIQNLSPKYQFILLLILTVVTIITLVYFGKLMIMNRRIRKLSEQARLNMEFSWQKGKGNKRNN